MTSDFIAAADIMTGAVVARAVEPDAGEGGGPVSRKCLNCSTELMGAHCHACGQKGNVHRTLHAFGHDFLHSVLHFDGKIWRTLPMLFWRPGDLTRRYIHGERAKFVSPLALFLFSVFLTFAAFNALMPTEIDANAVVDKNKAQAEYDADRKEILDDIAKLEADKKEAIAEGQYGYQWMDGAIERHNKSLKSLEEGRGKEIRRTDIAARKISLEKSKLEISIAKLEADLAAAEKAGAPTTSIQEQLDGERLGLKMIGNAANALSLGQTTDAKWTFTDVNFPGVTSLNEAAKHASENPQLLLYKIQSNTYKFSWALIPISVPFVWLLFFWRRKFKLFDHAVFVTYSLTFMMLLGTASALLIQFPATAVIGGLALSFLPPIHMYRQLHHAYETSRFGAFWRMCVLTVFAITALGLFASLVIALGVTG
jgi:Protein of unknown function (DUF3667)